MGKELKKIRVAPGSEVAKLLTEAATEPVLLEKDGEVYRLSRVKAEKEDPFANYDPDAALEGIRAAAGSWRDIDLEAFKAFIYRAREEGTRPPDRP